MNISGFENLPRDIKCEISRELSLSEVKALNLTSKDTKNIVRNCLINLVADYTQTSDLVSVSFVMQYPKLKYAIDYSIDANSKDNTALLAQHPSLLETNIRFPDVAVGDFIGYVRLFLSNYNVSKDFRFTFYNKNEEDNITLTRTLLDTIAFSSGLRRHSVLINLVGTKVPTLKVYAGDLSVPATIWLTRKTSIDTVIIGSVEMTVFDDLLRLFEDMPSLRIITLYNTSYFDYFREEDVVYELLDYFNRQKKKYPNIEVFLPIPFAVITSDFIDLFLDIFPNIKRIDIDTTLQSYEAIQKVIDELNRRKLNYVLWDILRPEGFYRENIDYYQGRFRNEFLDDQ